MVADMQPFIVMEVLERAQQLEKQGISIIHLEVGEPDFDMPTMMCNTYNERRFYMIDRLQKMGFGLRAVPEGAFYIFADARRFTDNAYSFAFDALEQAHVGITPGIDFGSQVFRMPTRWRTLNRARLIGRLASI